MIKEFALFVLCCLIITLDACQKRDNELNQLARIHKTYINDLVEFEKQTQELSDQVKNNVASNEVKNAFLRTREKFKVIEFIAEYYFPATAKSINGPAIDEVEEDDPLKLTVPPEGLQVIEGFIFPEYSSENKNEVQKEIGKLLSSIKRLKKVSENTAFTKPQILEAVKLEIFRIVSLGISGFDSPIAFNSLPESQMSLQSIQKYLALLNKDQTIKSLRPLNISLDNAISFVSKGDFDSFDRLNFITRYINPIYKNINNYQIELGIEFGQNSKAVILNRPELFTTESFNLNYFTPETLSHTSAEKIQLGKILFYDPLLSGNNQRACASCHNPERAFSDGKEKSIAFNFKGVVKRNAPTVINAGLQTALFHDGRVMYLEDQASNVVGNPAEMHSSMKAATEKIKKSDQYMDLFKKAFPASNNAVTEKNLKIALASFTRSLSGLNSRFDQYLQGKNKNLRDTEVKGFNLFMGKAKCGTCHFIPLFNGLVPPSFEVSEAEVIGVPSEQKPTQIDPDLGKYLIFKAEKNKYAFKTPTLRNIEVTAPYMHNGVFKTLKEVVEFYNKGGGKGIGLDLPNQTLPEGKLNLTSEEEDHLVAFMKTLTDTTGMTSVPKRLPLFEDASLNKRTIGGKY